MIALVELAKIRLDGGTQPRGAITVEVVQDYAEAIARGDKLPALEVFFDGVDHWLADGFHRYHALLTTGAKAAECDLQQGTQRAAILHSVGANADHGLRRTRDDKRRAVMRLLNDPEWATWPDREVSRACHVSHTFVQNLRAAHLATLPDRPAARTVARGGSTYTMKPGAARRREGRPQAAPAAPPTPLPPITQAGAGPIREQAFAPARADLEQGSAIFNALRALKAAFAELPEPEEAAQRFPLILRHTFSASQAEHLAEQLCTWFRLFGIAWTIENGGTHVHIAAE